MIREFINIVLAENAVAQFAGAAHEEWRRNFDPTGIKPRIKKNSDGTEGDINVPFDQLHPTAQQENLAAGQAAVMYDGTRVIGSATVSRSRRSASL